MAIRRTTPALLGLFSLIALLVDRQMRRAVGVSRQAAWYRKRHPTFADALALVRKEEDDFSTVLVCRLDRLGRSLPVTVNAHDRLQARGVALKSATEPIDTSNPSGKLIFQMLASFAEYERETSGRGLGRACTAFRTHRQLVRLLVAEVTVGKKPETGETEVRVTYRFGPPPEPGDAAYPPEEGTFGDHFKNGRESITPGTNIPTLNVVVLR